MLYKDHWDETKKRFDAFWHQELTDRCLVGVSALKNPVHFPAPPIDGPKEELRKFWLDPETIIKNNRFRMENIYYGGDAFPHACLSLGAAGHAAFFKNAKYQFIDSMWFDPTLEDVNDLEYVENSEMYLKTLEVAKALVEDSRGDYVVSMPDTTGNADALSLLMSPEELLPTMIEDPEGVKAALQKIEKSYESIMSDVYNIVKDVNDGGSSIGWLDTWAPGFHAQLQCDISVMISNQMYKDFIVDELKAQSEFLDYALYHLDGQEQIRHLDDILSTPGIKAIQWTQVQGQPPCTAFIPELQRIQKAGKSLLIQVASSQIEPLMEQLSSKGLYLITYAGSVDEANQIVKDVSKWTHE